MNAARPSTSAGGAKVVSPGREAWVKHEYMAEPQRGDTNTKHEEGGVLPFPPGSLYRSSNSATLSS